VCNIDTIIQEDRICKSFLKTKGIINLLLNLLHKKFRRYKNMALSNLAEFSTTGTGCGAGDKPVETPEEKPSACGSACGAGDKPVETPEEKPSTCGSACGASDK